MDKDSFQRMEELLRNAAYFKAIFDEEDLLSIPAEQSRIRDFVIGVYDAFKHLSLEEQRLITERYFHAESRYIKNYEVFQKMCIGHDKYNLLRQRAFDKLAILLQLGAET